MINNLEEYDDPYVYEAEYGQYRGDSDLFLNLIEKGSVLDLGCGTGRLAIPQLEEHIELFWIPLVQLKIIDLRPEPFKTLIAEWLAQDMNTAFQSYME